MKVAGENPDFLVHDLFHAIQKGDYPVWDVFVQVMDPKEAETYKWNIFDMTKVWPHQDFPLRQIGRLRLNSNVSISRLYYRPSSGENRELANDCIYPRQPRNYFTDIEQAAFSPSTMVPGFAPSADPSSVSHTPIS